jgi:hypothetical protein
VASVSLIVAALAFTYFRLNDPPMQVIKDSAAWLLFTFLGTPDLNGFHKFPRSKELCSAPIAAMLERLKAKSPSVDIMHTYDVPCSTTVCGFNFDGLPIHRFDDYHHLSAAGSSLLFPKYMARHPDELDTILQRRAAQ